MLFGGEAFGRSLGHEGEALVNGITDLISRDTREIISLPLPCEDTVIKHLPTIQKKDLYQELTDPVVLRAQNCENLVIAVQAD